MQELMKRVWLTSSVLAQTRLVVYKQTDSWLKTTSQQWTLIWLILCHDGLRDSFLPHGFQSESFWYQCSFGRTAVCHLYIQIKLLVHCNKIQTILLLTVIQYYNPPNNFCKLSLDKIDHMIRNQMMVIRGYLPSDLISVVWFYFNGRKTWRNKQTFKLNF